MRGKVKKMEREEKLDYFAALPEGCVSEILSFTSPVDAIRSSLISKGFKFAVESNTVWEKFLPPGYEEIIARSSEPVVYATKKELYFALCDCPILIDDGKMSFSLDKRTGKKCYMLGAKVLPISWGDAPQYWQWTSPSDSRFSEVAELRSVWWLDIRGMIETRVLSPKTTYAAYFVYKLGRFSGGLETAKAIIRYVNREMDNEAEAKASIVHLKVESWTPNHLGQLPKRRNDGWMEVELGEFYNDQGDDGKVEGRLLETGTPKYGLIVEGIEFRPKTGRG